MNWRKRCAIVAGIILLQIFACIGCSGNMQQMQAVVQDEEQIPLSETIADEDIYASDGGEIEQNQAVMGQESATEEEKQTASLLMVGDVLLHTAVSESGMMEDGSYNYDHMFVQVKDEIEAADLAIVNQEVILGGRELGLSGYPAFNGAYEVGDSLVQAGFDVVLHATNHALDKGKKGLLNCLNFWQENYPQIGVLGIHKTQEEADDIYVTEVNGIRIAILNYTYGTNGIALPKDMPYAVDLWNEEAITADVAKAKEQADFIIVCPHWGTEYMLEETAQQQEKAQFLANLGVDLIIGTHPHVVEPVEWITAEDGSQTLVYYSIGNFINATSGTGKGTAARMVGAIALVTVSMENQDAYISEYGIEPVVTHLVKERGAITTYRLNDYTQQLAEANEIRRQDADFSYEYCQELCEEVFGNLYFASLDKSRADNGNSE